jgi:MinD superfamily P-loop ATPase
VADKWMPTILEDRCTGCGLCVEACGPKSLVMADGIAVLAFPDTCGSEEHCIAVCMDEAIQMAWLPFSGNRTVGRWNEGIDREPVTCPGNGPFS